MQYFVYILFSPSKGKYYIGHTQDLVNRLFRHNNSGSKATKQAKDWILVYQEPYKSRSEAYKREKFIKNRKSRSFIQLLIASTG